MTDDLVKRLRDRADEQERCNSYPVDREMDREAAARIKELEAEIKTVHNNALEHAIISIRTSVHGGMWIEEGIVEHLRQRHIAAIRDIKVKP